MSTHTPQRVKKSLSVDWGHLLTVMAMGAWALWYLADLRKSSLSLENTLLVQPLIFVFVLMLLAVVPQCLRKNDLPADLHPETLDRSSFLKILGLMLSFALCIWGMFAVAFDISVFLFSFVTLWICGERRWWVMLLFSSLATVILIKGYQLLVPFQMPNILLG
jgi:putative tricarboxylic transport membrane protein